MPTPGITVDASGISASAYADWLTYLQDSYRSIYGSDIYIETDSQDGQLLAILSLAFTDTGNSAVSVYNDFSPATAQGAGLSSVIKVNGIQRQVPTNSTAVVTLVGQPGFTITGGIIGDNLNLGTRWSIPPTTIPPGGSINVTATCLTPGNVTVGAGTLTDITTPMPGWQTVTNVLPVVPGAPVETDAALRRRQSRSASLPADTTANGIYAAVANVVGVSRAEVYQNDTTVPTVDGIQARSVAVVAEGGNSGDIAAAIALKKPPGIPTVGTTLVTVVDSRGVPDTIRYYPLSLVLMHALVFLTALPGYVSTTAGLVSASLARFYNDAAIGDDAYLTRAYTPVNLTGASAQAATGLIQTQLDVLSATYHITKLVHGNDYMVAEGAYPAGTNVIIVAFATANFTTVGEVLYINLDDLSHHRATILSYNVGTRALTFIPAIPVGRSVIDNAQLYVEGDVSIAFNEASLGDPAAVTVVVT